MAKPTLPPMLTSQFEFSKIMVRYGIAIFMAQTIITLAIIFFRLESAGYAVSLMNATIPLYAVIFGGYFGKAGFENYQKIKSEMTTTTEFSTTTEPTTAPISNGVG